MFHNIYEIEHKKFLNFLLHAFSYTFVDTKIQRIFIICCASSNNAKLQTKKKERSLVHTMDRSICVLLELCKMLDEKFYCQVNGRSIAKFKMTQCKNIICRSVYVQIMFKSVSLSHKSTQFT